MPSASRERRFPPRTPLPEDAAPPPLDGESTVVGQLDMGDKGDRNKFYQSIRRNWPVDPEQREQCFRALDVVIGREIAKEKPDPDPVMAAVRCLLVEHANALRAVREWRALEQSGARKPPAPPPASTKPERDFDAERVRFLCRRGQDAQEAGG